MENVSAEALQLQQGGAALLDTRMKLQDDELAWANHIKATITANEMLHNLTDFEYAQWAIVTLARQNMDEVLQRVYKYQHFLKEYKISKSPSKSLVQEGLEIIQAFMNKLPRYLLDIDYMASQGHYLLVLDLSVLDPSKFKTEQDWRILIGGYFMCFQMMNSNFAAIRQGIACMLECMDMGLHNVSQYLCERVSTDLCEYYPMRQKEGIWLNTPTAANFFLTFVRPFLPDDLKGTIRMGCKLAGHEEKIDKLFLTPTPEAAKANLLVKIERFLVERQYNQSTYKLSSLPNHESSL